MMDRSAKLRALFATYAVMSGDIADTAIERAFAAVPRERFLGPPPWFMPVAPSPSAPEARRYLPTPDDDPAFIYTDSR